MICYSTVSHKKSALRTFTHQQQTFLSASSSVPDFVPRDIGPALKNFSDVRCLRLSRPILLLPLASPVLSSLAQVHSLHSSGVEIPCFATTLVFLLAQPPKVSLQQELTRHCLRRCASVLYDLQQNRAAPRYLKVAGDLIGCAEIRLEKHF